MPDITMCEGTNCPLAESCYRFKAKPSKWMQSYFADVPYDHNKKRCGYYYRIEK